MRLFALAAMATVAPCVFAQSPAVASALTGRYCATCHSQKLKTAGVVLQGLDLSDVGANAALLEKVARKVRTGEMPPAGMPRPDAATSASFTAWLQEALDRSAAAHPDPGRPVIHRLNRAEYSNAIRDLLALDTKPGELLPIDDSGYGFDNIGDVLSVSPSLLERYMSAARRVSRMAVGDPTTKPADEEFSARELGMRTIRNERVSDDLPFDSRGGLSFQYYFPLDAEYVVRIKLGNEKPGEEPREIRLPVKAGLHTVGVAFLRESAKPEIASPPSKRGAPVLPMGGPRPAMPPAQLDLRLDDAALKRFEVPQGGGPQPGGGIPQVDKVVVSGPYNITGRGDTPSRERIFVCRPTGPKDEDACAHKILATLARRAFRRPVTDSDIQPLLAFYKGGRAQGDFDDGIQRALRAMLVSPDFLFRIERDPAKAAAGSIHCVNDFELASRLSFFLWSSIPDDELLALAEKQKLQDPAVLTQQVHRMLDDPRSQALVDNFAGQWLYLRNVAAMKPDPVVFPDFDDSLRQSFEHETSLFFQSVLREDRSVTDLLDANYTFLNERLAEHYGVPNIYGSQFRQVALTDPNRGGLLGQGSILLVTSYPNRTSVVQRGKWILENLLGTPPPPPPPDIPDLVAHSKDGHELTMRQQMEQHRSNAVCASCHARMDPLGFALENYDGIGKWRAKDAGSVIDPAGKLPDGTVFSGPAGLKKALQTDHRDEFLSTFTAKLLTYALGRGLEYYDQPAIRAITRGAATENYKFSAMVTEIVKSVPFQMRRTPEP
jgi:uncharacterized protein DUF1592/uncharacterized protein DUF1588/uncharacterized protein DUF1587/uncharacterized protein DUF1595/uncharacterized protein DUF1585